MFSSNKWTNKKKWKEKTFNKWKQNLKKIWQKKSIYYLYCTMIFYLHFINPYEKYNGYLIVWNTRNRSSWRFKWHFKKKGCNFFFFRQQLFQFYLYTTCNLNGNSHQISKILILFPVQFASFNGSQLAKNEKEYSWHAPAMKFKAMKKLV